MVSGRLAQSVRSAAASIFMQRPVIKLFACWEPIRQPPCLIIFCKLDVLGDAGLHKSVCVRRRIAGALQVSAANASQEYIAVIHAFASYRLPIGGINLDQQPDKAAHSNCRVPFS
ncbi:hypothetical protein [Rhizobium sullae]|uniref:hypothetical protein n=1 Tax=Rhizobium sullae TaxID=50338 RepID=UPI00117B76D9|nr:hypothetical protein [Rhizobium sullae]